MHRLPFAHHASYMGVSYRYATDDDLTFLLCVYRSTRETELARVQWSEDQKQSFIDMQFQAQRDHYTRHYPDALWLIINLNEVSIGRLYLERWSKELRIIDIALVPSARGKGVATAILRDLQAEATETNKKIGIHVEKSNPAMTLYRSLGFKTIEDKGVYHLMNWSPPRPEEESIA